MMQEQFVSYEIAVKLKKLGFDESCFAHYQNSKSTVIQRAILKSSGQLYYNQNNINPSNQYGDEFCTAPLWDQVIDWLDFKGKIISVKPTTRSGSIRYIYSISVALVKPNEGAIITQMSVDSYTTRAEAREQAIIKALTIVK